MNPMTRRHSDPYLLECKSCLKEKPQPIALRSVWSGWSVFRVTGAQRIVAGAVLRKVEAEVKHDE